MRIFLILSLLAFLILPSHRAIADEKMQDYYWDLLMEGDIEHLEAEYDALHDTVKTGEYSYEQHRDVFRLFQTTHPGVIKLLDEWLLAYPNSRHALTGMMWHKHHIAFVYRPVGYSRYVHDKAWVKFHAYIEEAHDLAKVVYRDHGDFVPGTDGIILMLRNRADKHLTLTYLTKIMKLSPNKGSLRRAAVAFSSRYSGNTRNLIDICALASSPTRPDEAYDPDLCLAEAYITGNITGFERRAWAQNIIDERGDAVGYYARLYDATVLRPDLERAKAAFEDRTQTEVWLAVKLAYVTRDFDAIGDEQGREAHDKARAVIHDPLSPISINTRIAQMRGIHSNRLNKLNDKYRLDVEAAGLPTDRHWTEEENAKGDSLLLAYGKAEKAARAEHDKDVRELIELGLEYGEYDPDLWIIRGEYADVDLQLPKLEAIAHGHKMAVIYSNYHAKYVANYYDMVRNFNEFTFSRMIENGVTKLGDVEIDPVAQRDKYACETVRAARLVKRACEFQPNENRCNGVQKFYVSPDDMLKKAHAENTCLAMLHSPVGVLEFSEP